LKSGSRAAIASGLLFAAAFPPLPLVVPAFVCLVPLAVAIARAADGEGRGRDAFRMGAWFSVVGCGLNLYWIAIALSLFTWLASLGYVATIFGLSVEIGVATLVLFVARRLTRWPLAALLPIVWVASELGMLHLGDFAFPWLPLGLAVARLPVAAQIADLSGVHGVSVWIAATNGLLADAWMRRERRYAVAGRLAVVGAAAVAVCAYGAWRLRTTELVPLARVTAVQPNISEDEKMQKAIGGRFIGILARLTRTAEENGSGEPQLVVWPETALPGYLTNNSDWVDSLRVLTTAHHVPILFGVLDYEILGANPRDYDYFNAAMLADTLGRTGTQPAYRKRYLVPIVERVPLVNPRWFSGLKYFGGFGRGGAPIAFHLPFGSAGVMICYESIFPDLARTYRRAGADLLLNITNDAWFARTSAPYQHESHLRLRAIETRAGVVRAANTGISEYIDPLGRPHGATGLFVSAVPTFDVATTHVRTLYVEWGDWAGTACAIAALVLAAVGTIRARRAPPARSTPRDRAP
jgi:apolipoprotein N-acyltransferase